MKRRLYAAIDLHSRTSVLGWMGERGKMIDTIRFETTEDNLREKVGALRAKEIHLTIEAAPLARWAGGIVRPLVTRLIVCDARRLGSAFPEIARFQEVPGIGEIGSAVFCAIIEDPVVSGNWITTESTDTQRVAVRAPGVISGRAPGFRTVRLPP